MAMSFASAAYQLQIVGKELFHVPNVVRHGPISNISQAFVFFFWVFVVIFIYYVSNKLEN
jgi:hypothetical protein